MLSGIGASRRGFLFGTGAFALASASFPATGWATTSERIVALDWVSAMNLLALGIVPAAMPELEHYTRLVVEPTLPQTTIELGLRSEPNLELIDSLKPSLIVRNTDAPLAGTELSSIAPVHIFDDRFSATVNPLDAGRTAMAKLASQLEAGSCFRMAQKRFADAVSEARNLLGNYGGRPLVIATVIDGRRLLIFGKNSLFQNALDLLGIENAWDGYTSHYGHTTVAADQLVAYAQARLLCVGDTSRDRLNMLLAAPVMKSLPFVRERRIVRIPDVLFYGGLPPAHRFIRLAAMALSQEPSL